MNSETIYYMSQIEITEINSSSLTNAEVVTVSSKMPHEEKVLSVMKQLGNPYCFMSGDTPVRVRFTNEEKALSDSLVSYFSQLKHS